MFGVAGALAYGVHQYVGYANTDQPHTSLRASDWPAQPEKIATPTGRPDRVIVVVLDGSSMAQSVDHASLAASGAPAAILDAVVPTPSLSRPGYATIGSGAPPARTGIRTNRYTTRYGVDTVFARATDAGMHVVGGANHDWMEQNFEGSFARWYFEYHWDDPDAVDRAMAGALAEEADLVLLHFVEVDKMAHRWGSAHPNTAQTETRLAKRLSALLQSVDLTNDTVIFTSDHGHLAAGGHGGGEPEVVHNKIIMIGRGVRAATPDGRAPLESVAPTVSVLLGLPWPYDMEAAPVWEALEPSVLGESYLEKRRAGWNAHRVAYERKWLANVYRDWTSENWRGQTVGNDVSAAATVPEDADLATLMAARARTLEEIQRDRRVGRTPIVALVIVPLVFLFVAGFLRGYRFTPVLAVPLFGLGAAGGFLGLAMPMSLSAINTYWAFVTKLAVAGGAGLLLWTVGAVLLTRGIPGVTRWRAIRFHASAAALVYCAIAPVVWGLLGFSVKAPLPGDFLLFFPLVAGSLGGGFAAAAGLLWLAAVVHPTARPFDIAHMQG